MSWQQRINIALGARRAAEATRVRTVLENGASRFLYYNGQRFCNFSSNDYLGLSQHPAVIRAWQQGAERYGVGSGSSGHVNGYAPAHCELEEALADWLGYPRALLFISGFTANQALIAALVGGEDLIIADRLSHTSLLEAASLSPARLRRFAHNQLDQLELLLDKYCAGQRLVITEGIFSMDGDAAPLSDILTVARARNAWTLVDDAHGIGVLGEKGCGSIAVHNVKPELLVITFGKGVGISGAAVLCSEAAAEYLLQFARHLIYSTNMPPAQAIAILAALKIIQGDDGVVRRQRLAERVQQFRNATTELNWQFSNSYSAIQPLIVGSNNCALQLVETLRNYGIWTTAIRPPTVPQGAARIRLTLTALHEPQDIDTLLEVLHAVGE